MQLFDFSDISLECARSLKYICLWLWWLLWFIFRQFLYVGPAKMANLLKELVPTNSMSIIFLKTPGNKFFYDGRNIVSWIEVKRLFFDGRDESSDWVRLVRAEAIEHLKQNDSNRPYICVDWVGFPSQDFRSHVKRRPEHSSGHRFASKFLTEPEIR